MARVHRHRQALISPEQWGAVLVGDGGSGRVEGWFSVHQRPQRGTALFRQDVWIDHTVVLWFIKKCGLIGKIMQRGLNSGHYYSFILFSFSPPHFLFLSISVMQAGLLWFPSFLQLALCGVQTPDESSDFTFIYLSSYWQTPSSSYQMDLI